LKAPTARPTLRAASYETTRRPSEELRRAIDCLPVETRQGMLDGIDHSRIIVGAYVDRQKRELERV
jgi:hypothetical protein